MGGKKKTLANRLAKMSDEERARYIQRKADMEEEAKRRKEQLIATFMKNKIKKEDAFSRLNLAKINQHWHQILRTDKCKQMKDDVQHMKKYIERVLDYKNRTILKLMEDLETAEKQYLRNFNSHASHIDQALDTNDNYLKMLDKQFKDDLDQIVDVGHQEEEELVNNATTEEIYLRTVIYRQELSAKKEATDLRERFMEQRDNIVADFRTRIESLSRDRERESCDIWSQIAAVVDAFVRHNDGRRRHLAELKVLDAESATEIIHNQERISAQEAEIKLLQEKYDNLVQERQDQVTSLENEFKDLTRQSMKMKRQLQSDIGKDEKKLFCLTTASDKTIRAFEKLKLRGAQIRCLMNTCKKFETEREQITKWWPICSFEEASGVADLKPHQVSNTRPKTSFATPVQDMQTVDKVIIEGKRMPSPPSEVDWDNMSSASDCFKQLLNMEQFWTVFNKVRVDFSELKGERKMLQDQNKQYRGLIRGVLEAAALAQQSIPASKVSTRVASKRSAASAPLKRIVI